MHLFPLYLIRSTALGEEGLYRVSGNKLDVDRLKAVLAAGLLVSSDTLQAHYPDKHVIAGAIKKVRRSLLSLHLVLLSFSFPTKTHLILFPPPNFHTHTNIFSFSSRYYKNTSLS